MPSIQEPLILEFRSPDQGHTPHLLQAVQGSCPEAVLATWRDEFSKRYHVLKNGQTFDFESAPRGLPTRFRVELPGDGRTKYARLTECREGKPVRLPTENATSTAGPSTQGHWQAQMLAELDRFITSFANDEAERTSLKFALTQMRLLSEESEEKLSLLLFGAFIAGAHSEEHQQEYPSADLLFQAAEAALRRTASDATQEVHSRFDADGSLWNWNCINRLFRRWLPAYRTKTPHAASTGSFVGNS